jgi:AcrR family transcriptional regulator
MKKGEQTQSKIVQAAIELFVRHGYHGTSLQSIMENIGLSKGAFYKHFKSKPELLHHILEQFNLKYLEGLKRTINESKEDALYKLNRIMSYNASYGEKNIDIFILHTNISHELDTHRDFELSIRSFYRKQQDLIAGVIRQGIKEGLVSKSIDPNLVALTLLAINEGMIHQYYMNRYHLDGKKYVKTMRRLFMDGIKKR